LRRSTGTSTRVRRAAVHTFIVPLAWHSIMSCPATQPGGRIAGGCVTGAAHVVGAVWHRMSLCATALESRGWNVRNEGTSVPGLHKNMRRNFSGCLVAGSSLSILCRPCSAHVASRVSFGRCLSGLCLISASGFAEHAVGMNYGTGPGMTLASAEGWNGSVVKTQRRIR